MIPPFLQIVTRSAAGFSGNTSLLKKSDGYVHRTLFF
jgi:hypothetical protein